MAFRLRNLRIPEHADICDEGRVIERERLGWALFRKAELVQAHAADRQGKDGDACGNSSLWHFVVLGRTRRDVQLPQQHDSPRRTHKPRSLPFVITLTVFPIDLAPLPIAGRDADASSTSAAYVASCCAVSRGAEGRHHARVRLVEWVLGGRLAVSRGSLLRSLLNMSTEKSPPAEPAPALANGAPVITTDSVESKVESGNSAPTAGAAAESTFVDAPGESTAPPESGALVGSPINPDERANSRSVHLRALPWPERTQEQEQEFMKAPGGFEQITVCLRSKTSSMITAVMRIFSMNLTVDSFDLHGRIPIQEECEEWLDFMKRKDFSPPPPPLMNLHEDLESAIAALNDITTVTAPFAGMGGYSIGSFRYVYSIDGQQWFPYRPDSFSSLGPGTQLHPSSWAPKQYAAIVQKQVQQEILPLEGFSHLRLRTGGPKQAWVEAAIAAELAIKDFVARSSELAAVILERLQSPPVQEMYGRVLKQIGGSESPVRKELAWGAEVRNHLVHRIRAPLPTSRVVFMYRYIVELALYHLMSILYPSISEIQFEYENRLRILNDDKAKKDGHYAHWKASIRSIYGVG